MSLEYRIYRPTEQRRLSAVLLGLEHAEDAVVGEVAQAEAAAPVVVTSIVEPEPDATDGSAVDRTWAASSIDDALVAILGGPSPGEPIRAAYTRMECELAQMLATVPQGEALAMHRRLAEPSPDDGTALAFGRLVAERRERLLAVLARTARGQVR